MLPLMRYLGRHDAATYLGISTSHLDRLGIPRPARAAGFHTFRHSAVSIINAKTGNLKLAQKLLGHSNLSTTADIYTHTSIEAEREAAVAVEQAVFGGSVPSCSQNREQEP